MNLYRQLRSFFDLLRTAEFSRGIRFAGAAVLPLLVTAQIERIEIGIAMAVGVLLTSPSDVPGSLRRRVIGVAFSVAIAILATIVTGFAMAHPLLFIPLLVLQIFLFSMISIFGFRASLISFSGLLAVVLGMAQVASEGGILMHAFWIGIGGVWYLLFTLILHFLLRRRETDLLLSETFELTAQYLEIRARLMSQKGEKSEALEKELFVLQTSINEKHEVIREMVITRRRNFGRSRMLRKRLLIFIELVDILELSMAHPVNNLRMEELFVAHRDKIALIEEWNMIMAKHLRATAETLGSKRPMMPTNELQLHRKKARKILRDFEVSADLAKENETLLVFRNFLSFKEKQYQKIVSIERLLMEWRGNEKLNLKRRDAAKLLTTPEYNIKTLQDNLDFKSPIFRHSIRLTAIMVAGYAVGEWFAIQNAYWILLTIVVIMRPGYALTRDRFKQRLYGTLIGGTIAVALIFVIRSQVMYGILAVISLVLAHSMIQRNYKTAAAFITLNVVFVYSLMRPNVLEVIQFRMLDTAVGAGLAFFGAKFLWPTWEYSTIHNFIRESIKSNAEFIKEVEDLYYSKSALPASYRLARKKAFLAIGDLNAAFQRMAQEPKTEESHLAEIFRIVSLNQEFLSATASLGTFIRSHATTSASSHFENYMAAIQINLKTREEKKDLPEDKDPVAIEAAALHYENLFQKLLDLEKDEAEDKEEVRERLQEVQILMDRLKWLLEISEGLKKYLAAKV